MFDLAHFYLDNKQGTKAAILFKNLLNNFDEEKECSCQKRILLHHYILSLKTSLNEDISDQLKEDNKNKLDAALLQEQDEFLQTNPKLNKQIKEEKHTKRIIKLKKALAEYHQEQEKLAQQKAQQELEYQELKKQYIKDKQKWALENQLGSLNIQNPIDSSTKKNKSKKKINMSLEESPQPILSPVNHQIKRNLRDCGVKIEGLIHGHHLEIFNKFFESCYGYKTDVQIQISREEFKILMDWLGQKTIHSKGSHDKTSFDFAQHGCTIEQTMVIVPNENNLPFYVIKQVREKFLDFGLCPQELIQILEDKGFLTH